LVEDEKRVKIGGLVLSNPKKWELSSNVMNLKILELINK